MTPPPLLLLHGSASNRESWPASARALGEAIDLPGRGREAPELASSIDDYMRAVLSAIAEPTVLVGHSLGGAVALHCALRCPERIAGLVLVGTGARLRVRPSVLRLLRYGFAFPLFCWMTRLSLGPRSSAALRKHIRQQAKAVGRATSLRDFEICDRFDALREIDKIGVPTLICQGTGDPLTPPKYGQFMHERIAGSRLELFEGVGHWPHWEMEARFVEIVREWLQSCYDA